MSIDYVFQGKEKDLGGFTVRRLLPMAQKRQVGPFVFLDHMGPLQIDERKKLDVRPHPHIGLATVTYLFRGEAFHADSLGSQQRLKPEAINLMVAGRGIAHSERTPHDIIELAPTMEGLQIWLALPKEHEDMAPEFFHHGAETLPSFSPTPNTSVKVLMGQYGDVRSPVKTFSKTLFCDVKMQTNDQVSLEFGCDEIGVYPVTADIEVNGQTIVKGHLAVFNHGETIQVTSSGPARFVILGGTAHPEKRFMWWNFVSSEKEKIVAAAEKWKRGERPAIAGETEWIPLPDDSYLNLK